MASFGVGFCARSLLSCRKLHWSQLSDHQASHSPRPCFLFSAKSVTGAVQSAPLKLPPNAPAQGWGYGWAARGTNRHRNIPRSTGTNESQRNGQVAKTRNENRNLSANLQPQGGRNNCEHGRPQVHQGHSTTGLQPPGSAAPRVCRGTTMWFRFAAVPASSTKSMCHGPGSAPLHAAREDAD